LRSRKSVKHLQRQCVKDVMELNSVGRGALGITKELIYISILL